MPGSVLNSKFSRHYYVRFGLILGGVWLLSIHPSQPAKVQSHRCIAAANFEAKASPTQCSNSIALYCRYMMAGDAQVGAANYGLAEKSYTAALLETTKFNASSYCRMETLHALGHTLTYEGKHSEALPLFERAEQICEQTLEANDIRRSESLLDLAISYEHNNQSAAAEDAFKRIDAIWQNAPAGWEENKVKSKNNLAAFYNGKVAKLLPHLPGATNKVIDPLYPYQQFSFHKAGAIFK